MVEMMCVMSCKGIDSATAVLVISSAPCCSSSVASWRIVSVLVFDFQCVFWNTDLACAVSTKILGFHDKELDLCK